MSTLTTNYDLIKPGVNDPTDQDLWGGYLNDDMDIIDSQLLIASNYVTEAVTGATVLDASDNKKLILADATGGAFSVTLPPVASTPNGYSVIIKRVNSGANAVTVDGDGSETIDGTATKVLNAQYESISIVNNQSSWQVISGASLNSPAFTGTPTAPTATYGTDSTQIATTAFVQDTLPVKAMVNFSVSGGVITVNKALNVTSVVTGTGGANTYKITFTNAMSNTGYCMVGTCKSVPNYVVMLEESEFFARSTTQVEVVSASVFFNGTIGAVESPVISVVVFDIP